MSRSFNGTSDQISATIASDPTSITASIWVYATSLPNAYNSAITGVDASAGNKSNFSIYVKSNGLLAMYYNASGASYDGTGSHTLSTNTWYNLVFVGDSSAGLTGYVNGASDATVATGYTHNQGATIMISNDFSALTRNWAGRLADAAVWSVSLKASEVSALANGARPNTIRSASLLFWWPLDGLQSPEPDLGGLRKNGTLTGTALAAGPPVMMATPRWPMGSILPATVPSIVFRRTLSSIGTRIGTRQMMNG